MPNVTKSTSQYMDNQSFDETYNINGVEVWGEDTTTGTHVLRRLQVSATGALVVQATIDPTGLATSTIQTDGTQKTQIVDAGGEAVTVTGGKLDVNASIDTTGLATSTLQTTGNNSLSSIDTKIPSLGQALAASSIPVVLTASQLSTLTPLSSVTVNTISGFALETGGNLATIAGAIASSKMNVNISSGSIANTSFASTQSGTWSTRTLDGSGNTIGSTSNALDINIKSGNPTTIAVTNTGTFATQTTLAAETTKVIGTVNQGTSPWTVSGAVTNTVLSVVGGGTEATAQRVTIASDSTGLLSIDDNGGSLTVDGSVSVSALPALPAGTNLVGIVSSSSETSTVYNGTTALTPGFALANISASTTDGAIVTAVTAHKIRVLAAVFMSGGTATNITFNSKPAGAGSAISALFATPANGGASLPYNPVGWFQSNSGEGLTATTGAGSTVGVQIVYVVV